MKSALLFAALFSTATVSHALVLKGSTPLNEWNTTQAGQALLQQDQVKAQIEVVATGDLAFAFGGYAKIEVCDELGDSPNGEPELAPCIRSHMTFAPKFTLALPVKLTTTVEDISGTQTAVLTSDLQGCIENYDSLVETKEPTAAPAHAALKAKCEFYLPSAQFRIGGVSAKLANSQVEVISSVLLESKLKSTHVITIDNGQVSPETAAEIAQAGKKLKSAGLGNTVYVIAKVKSRAGKELDLFNYGLNIELK
jgi:hypothetical protein